MSETRELAALVAEALWAGGTRLVFGLPGGGANLDAVGAAVEQGMRFVLAHSETFAVIMAATYGELTAAPGFCIVTRGPGAASSVNGVVHALLDRDPMVLLTDCVQQTDRSRISHQRIDQHALFAPVTKLTERLGQSSRRETIDAVVEAATTPPWGPSHITIDPSAASSSVVSRSLGLTLSDSRLRPSEPDRHAALAAALELLRSARRPVVLVGSGARFEAAAVRWFVEGTRVPVLSTYKARGIVGDSSPDAGGTITGGSMERALVNQADLIITIGLDPVELIPAEWGYDASVLSLSSYTADSTYFRPTVEVVGPLSAAMEALGDRLSDGWDAGVARRHRLTSRQKLMVSVDGLAPHDLVDMIRQAAPDDTSVTVDAGAHMLVAIDIWSVEEPGRILISNGAATMGYALPAAIAAALVHPGRPIVCLVGDGGMSMVSAELETIDRLGLDVEVVVFNDSALSLIEIKQGPGQVGGEAARFAPTDFAAIARGHGVTAHEAADTGDVERAASAMFARPGPARRC